MAKVIEFIWKIWLRLNFLTQDVDNVYTGEVSTMGHTVRNEDIAQRIVNPTCHLYPIKKPKTGIGYFF